MALHEFKRSQFIPISVQEAWDFFSSPKNLKIITPDYMGFDIVTGEEEGKMYPGMIISYKVSPLLGLKMDWVTEITHVDAPHFFVDEQRSGPYAFWHHKHYLKEAEGGTFIEDVVHYKIPFGILGNWMNYFMIENKLNEIFEYRQKKLEELFGK